MLIMLTIIEMCLYNGSIDACFVGDHYSPQKYML